MIDICFSKLILIFIIGLIVLGPQKLPIAVKIIINWINVIRSLITNVQYDFAQEFKIKNFKNHLENASKLDYNVMSSKINSSIEDVCKKTTNSMKLPNQQNIFLEKENKN